MEEHLHGPCCVSKCWWKCYIHCQQQHYINIIIVKKSFSMKKYSLFKSVQVDIISVSEFSLLKLKKKNKNCWQLFTRQKLIERVFVFFLLWYKYCYNVIKEDIPLPIRVWQPGHLILCHWYILSLVNCQQTLYLFIWSKCTRFFHTPLVVHHEIFFQFEYTCP